MDTQNSTEENTNSNLPKKSWFKAKIVLALWAIAILGWLFLFWFFNSLNTNEKRFGRMPSLQELENPETQIASEIYTADSVLLGKYFNKNRTYVPFEDLSPIVMNTLLATEDIRFYDHNGIDVKGILSIPFYLLKGKKKGASTITQQLAKNLYKSRTKDFDGSWTTGNSKLREGIIKMKEWFTAINIESAYTKQEIMTMYLNTVDFGQNSFGIKVAAETYYGKDQKDLKYEEAATLIGLLKATHKYNPKSNPKNAKKRRKTVFDQLHKYKFLQQEEYDSLKNTEIVLAFSVADQNKGEATYFREEAKKFLKTWCEANGYDIYKDGLRVYSTLDSKLQRYAQKSMEDHIKSHQAKFFKHWEGKNPWTLKNDYGRYKEIDGFIEQHIKRTYAYRVYKKRFKDDEKQIELALNKPKKMKIFTWEGEKDTTFSSYDSLKYYKHFLHVGFMSMEPKTGHIKAWVGGINYKYFKYDHVKQGKRQPGSTFKPIVYTTILGEIGEKYGPCYKVADLPVTFETTDPENPIWSPQNAEGRFSGDTLTIRQALALSKNSITAYMMKILGPQTPRKVLEYAGRLGINTNKMEAVPAMCLGTFDVSLFEMVGAYGTFMNQGVHTEPQFIDAIYDRHGNLLEKFKPKTHIAISKELAYVMQYMLRGGTQEKGGTGTGLYRYGIMAHNEIGTKTGTTQDYSDGWFMGVTPQLVSGCWVGCEDRTVHFRTLGLGQGSKMALPVFANYMKKVYADSTTGIKRQAFPQPMGYQKANYKIITDCSEYLQVKSDSALFESKKLEIFEDDEEDDGLGF